MGKLKAIDYSNYTMPYEFSENFLVGKDDFSNLEIHSVSNDDNFYYFYHKKQKRLIKQFILNSKKQVDYICRVNLIKKGNKFTPRLAFSIRNKAGNIRQTASKQKLIKANVDLNDCYQKFWKLISFIRTVKNINIPKEPFSLISKDEKEIIDALKTRSPESIKNIAKSLLKFKGVTFTDKDVNQTLNRKAVLKEFKKSIISKNLDEGYWQNFFENNKWIFGYGLNYQILKQEQSQPNYGGTLLSGKGGQKGDYLTSTQGDINFTVLVEIKTPDTPLLQGTKEIRSGAWSLSKKLTDSIVQIQANSDTWYKEGSEKDSNKDRLEKQNTFTVQPKGIIVIGSLKKLDNRNKFKTFQKFRGSIHRVDIITFDELLKRAEYIVSDKNEKTTND